ncbi:MAG: DNA repair protein RecO [Bacteroidia bacterium]|nr:DNA repair protein RecO [Bacteroidia bacterium]
MLHKTRGIIFHTTEYSETSLIARIYTELFGLQSYIINSVRKKNARVKAHTFQPLTPVDMVVYHKEKGGLQRIAEVIPCRPFRNTPFDLKRSSMVLFLNEVLYKSVKEEEPNQILFDYLFHSLELLDVQSPLNTDFHLFFCFQLSKYLGFFPSNNFSQVNNIFDFRDGGFRNEPPPHPFYTEPSDSLLVYRILSSLPDFQAQTGFTTADRKKVLHILLEYFSIHVEGFGNLRSLKILEQIWD